MKNNLNLLNQIKEYSIIFLIFFFSIILFCDQNWEPSAETYKHWVSVKILEDTLRFNDATGSLYTLYLYLFSKVEFPISVILERYTSVIFICVSIFLLLRIFLNKYITLILIISWLPYLWIIESTSRLIAVGLISLYFYTNYDKKKIEFFPILLLSAILIDKLAALFFIGHLLFFFIKKIKINLSKFKIFEYKNIIKVFLFILLFFSTILQSNLKEANHYGVDYPFAPINLKDGSYNGVFFQVGTWRWIKRQFYLKKLDNIYEENDLYKADWYFFQQKAFNNSKKFYHTIYLAPKELALNIFRNLKDGMDITSNLIFGYNQEQNRFITIISVFFSIFSFLFLTMKNYRGGNGHIFFTLSFGTITCFLALLPILFSYRYNIIFIPFFLLVTIFIVPSLNFVLKILQDKNKNKIFSKKFIILNFIFIFIASTCFLLKLTHNYILIFLCLITLVFIFGNFIKFFNNIRPLKKIYNQSLSKNLVFINHIFIIFISINVFLNNKFFFKQKIINTDIVIQKFENSRHFINFIKNENLKNKFNLSPHPQIITAFGFGSLEKSKSIGFLPPYYDEKKFDFLKKFEVIFLPYEFFKGPFVSQSTQDYLRFELYLKKYIDSETKNNNLNKIKIQNYGFAFKKIN